MTLEAGCRQDNFPPKIINILYFQLGFNKIQRQTYGHYLHIQFPFTVQRCFFKHIFKTFSDHLDIP